MKIKNFVDIILTIAIYALGTIGVLLVLGSVGALECDNISIGKFFAQELQAIGCIVLAYIVSVYRSYYRHFHMNNEY